MHGRTAPTSTASSKRPTGRMRPTVSLGSTRRTASASSSRSVRIRSTGAAASPPPCPRTRCTACVRPARTQPSFTRAAMPPIRRRSCSTSRSASCSTRGRARSGDSDPGRKYRALVNRLADETSPYLLQHAENPVDWYAWGDQAFAKAREEDKPILLSVGYAACHWCHVMAHESFEDDATAAVMNELFVNVKVDREERPDVDSLYMDAVVALTGSGGWPMTVFLTPAGEPFLGGTYFPPEPRHGLPSFRQVLTQVAQAYRERH